jgi:hypothetical protein
VSSAWCVERQLEHLPATAATVALYIVALAGEGLKPATIERRLVAINREHKIGKFPLPGLAPGVREVLQGIRRSQGSAQRQIAALLTDDLKTMLAA